MSLATVPATPAAAARRWLIGTALALVALASPWAAQAEQVSLFVPYSGAGNVSVFDATAGTGGWVGSIDQTPPPAGSLSLVSFVLFQLNAATQTLTGSFQFTTTDLASTLFGDVSGNYDPAAILTSGGQFSLDYTIRGGTGALTDSSGFGIAFVDYDPSGVFNNYSETGLLVVTVPEPASLALAGAGCLLLVGTRRRQFRSRVDFASRR